MLEGCFHSERLRCKRLYSLFPHPRLDEIDSINPELEKHHVFAGSGSRELRHKFNAVFAANLPPIAMINLHGSIGRYFVQRYQVHPLVPSALVPRTRLGYVLQYRMGGRMNPLVSKAHSKDKRWSAGYAALRQLCLASGLNEELKWGHACYDLEGTNVFLIHGFKDYCALLFMKGALLKDPEKILVQQTRNVQAARQIRFASLSDINRKRSVVMAYIREAILVEKSGAKVEMRAVAQFQVPEELQDRLDDDPELSAAFRALTPGRQKAYLLHFAGAKLSATRTARVAKHAPRILRGLGLDD